MNNIFENEADWRLTPEEIRAVKGFEDATDDDVENIINTFTLLGQAFYEGYISEMRNEQSITSSIK